MIKKIKAVTKDYVKEHKDLYDKGLPNKYMELFHQKIEGVRKAKIVYGFSQAEMIEYSKCQNDIIYFIEKYCSILTPDGIVKPRLYDYQKTMLENYTNNRFSLNMISRQMGISNIIAWFTLHMLTFNESKNAIFMDIKSGYCKSLLEKVKTSYKMLPFFLQKGVITWNQRSIVLEDYSRITTQSYSKEPVISSDIHLLYMDNYSRTTTSETSYKYLLPTITSTNDSRIIISGKPKGFNHFIKLLHNSELPSNHPDKNIFESLRVYWWQHPNKNEEWKKQEIENIGQQMFDQEYDLKFTNK